MSTIKGWTDYPITELGDIPNQPAPIREVEAISWDGDKYVTVKVGEVTKEIKYGYLYTQPGRCGSGVELINYSQLPRTPGYAP